MTPTRKPAPGAGSEPKQIGRLALRHEGNLWNAYYAMPATMDGAVFLGSVAIQFVQSSARKAAFMNLMSEAVADIIEQQIGVRPTFPDGPQAAPEHERAGHS